MMKDLLRLAWHCGKLAVKARLRAMLSRRKPMSDEEADWLYARGEEAMKREYTVMSDWNPYANPFLGKSDDRPN